MKNKSIVSRAILSLVIGICVCVGASPRAAFGNVKDPSAIVRKALDHLRDTSSCTELVLTIHRPDWERASTVKVWTKGSDRSLVRFLAPTKDEGNASLTVGDDIWSYSPKVSRVIKIPPSMKHQTWMGSDSYEDLSKGDSVFTDYTHKLVRTGKADGHTVFVIESTPLENASIVWGKEVLAIRDDNIILSHQFFDQQGKLVKELKALKIGMLGKKRYATRVRMENKEEEGFWTEAEIKQATFGQPMADSTFNAASLTTSRGN